jgi:predicted RecA/RadA family phage recombinase
MTFQPIPKRDEVISMGSTVQEGKYLDYTPGSAVASGDIVVIGSLVGVAASDIAANKLGAVAIEGVAEMPCASGATGAQGSAINWYATSGVAHASTGVAAGKLAKARLAADTSVHVLINR